MFRKTLLFRRISITLVCLLILICNCASAAKSDIPVRNTMDMPDPSTERRNAFEFCELYIKHLYDAEKNTGLDIVSHGIGSMYSLMDWNENNYYADCSAGNMMIDKDDFSISEVSFLLFDSIANDDSLVATMYSAAASIAALEYDDFDDDIVELTYDIGYSDVRNTTEWAEDLILDRIFPMITTEHFAEMLASGKPVRVYKGNYTYYASYDEFTYDGKTHGYTHLTAKHE